MKIKNILTQQLTQCGIPGGSKKRVLENLSTFVTEQLGGDGDQAENLFHNLVARERLGSTGIGEGVAIPHCRVAGFNRIHGCLIKLEQAIDFGSLDDQPVDLIFALIVPEEQNEEHLATLARVAAIMQDDSSRMSLRQCSSSEELYTTALQLERAA
ncbi:Phosphotransferase system mannitol/fructose-specific IIA domain(Ntr-type) [marine gamma proteobacterium HTCC2207]|jgi:PTS system nitrogen regulatory IIA component|uniref:Phosphotransferase system mannitol/fructose-specific IIA domain(Ntr-type) n=1 Tax=gamma proteobacterium HTCC2207 TaxID=314287 RepID=Q1YU18_9GAMM|nr:Phosphotransferase system mannitol/fructose-specific IIA domain(Ntr-type) [marine gamma proteobacterium HTCC2207] [gamma proteobacterium HTCC2207]MBT5104724.1 PTS transporter subunit EIIA [Porticoccaceae bacterium]MBT6115873.1 PTS transporter subunit EIIA [Porticoccaceae bacterium]MBT6592860.1 PTS transporter subunit EIIA [Porticoccaceae bacterium]MDB4427913.1 PTS sugar transporter subunit IIA [Porticoccaceae bacterium]